MALRLERRSGSRVGHGRLGPPRIHFARFCRIHWRAFAVDPGLAADRGDWGIASAPSARGRALRGHDGGPADSHPYLLARELRKLAANKAFTPAGRTAAPAGRPQR